MASNGYMRAKCSGCLFYMYGEGSINYCTLYRTGYDADELKWVSWLDCREDPRLRNKYYEECEHYTSVKELKNQTREKFRIDKIVYNY